ncbi:HAD-IA family hydrolase [Bradyrhizobium sp. WYCCWR 13023]|uniref:HAD-IA family hydrolase n=1 Tax=Bradyrhizobium zhengyangense TaxID=2911009 RepID=A0A9X1R7Z8_9BRAD|nr:MULTISPECIES: HAD-IA family hydrolase [Bradyrhizobium]MCG2626198.1 HAD-IA family hydrolase [Bradyrhizobium zhengyangense]MDA9524491.1 HAD family hydrolase [Bradyrhizobium sp. CCBAU 11434]
MIASTASALVLDFGGVISKTLFETHDATEAALGLPKGTLTWRGPFAVRTDPLWSAMQCGELSERDYWLTRSREVGRLIGEDWRDMQTFVRRARGADPMLVIRPEAERAVRIAREAGRKLAILSNELDLFYGEEFGRRLPLLEHFDVIVDATYTKILKPDPRAYSAVCDALGLAPQACVFVDDQERNIKGAIACGLPTVWFDVRHPRDSYRQALQMLGLAFD